MNRLLVCAALAASLLACTKHDHGEGGHDHGPGDRPGAAVTHFGARTELFVEFPVLVRGEESRFAAHLNDLQRFKPLEKGRVEVILSGGGSPEERFEVVDPSPVGIFRPVVKPAHAGKRNLVLTVDGPAGQDRHDLGEVQVFATLPEAAAAGEAEEPAGLVPYLKEQQWRTDFATAAAEEATLRGSVLANGTLRTRPGGESRISAPVTGRIVARGEYPSIGRAVKAGEVLAELAPRVSGDADPASLELAATQARLDTDLARKDLARLEELSKAEAVSDRRVQDARRALSEAEARLSAAEARWARYESSSSGLTGARIALRSTVTGTLAEVAASPGSLVEEGRELFHVVDLDRLWLEVLVPEADVPRILAPSGAWFEVEGFEQPFEVSVERGGRVVGFGGIIDPQTRTAPLVMELPNPGRALRVGMFARVHVYTGEPVKAVTIPVSALVDDGVEEVVFVEVSGERFEKRVVRTGVRERDRIQVLSGLRAGERVVSRGAYQVRLAAASGAIPQHGHVH